MPKGGLEPPCQLRHNALNVACLPISPLRLNFVFPLGDVYNNTGIPPLCQVFFRHLYNTSSEDPGIFVMANGNQSTWRGKMRVDRFMYIYSISRPGLLIC